MAASVGVFYGILALLLWGLSDFLAKRVISRHGHFRSAFWVQFFGLLPFLLLYPFLGSPFSLSELSLFIFTGLVSGLGFFFFYKGIGKGYLSIISPITCSWSVITALLGIFILGELLTFVQSFAISVVFAGIVLASFHYEDLVRLNLKNALPGVRDALAAVACFGLGMFLLGFCIQKAGWFLPIFFLRLLSFAFFLSYTRLDLSRVSIPTGFSPSLLLIGLLEALGLIGFGFATTSEYLAIVSPVAASSPIVTLALARLFLGERISANQSLGVLLIVSGVVLLAF